MVVVHRTEVMEVGIEPTLSLLCHQVKNLYNRANFIFKQKQQCKIFLSYFELDRILKFEECYKILPAHTAQHTLKFLIRNWKSYFQTRKEWKKNPDKFLGFPRSPKYKSQDGECVAIISNQQARIVNGMLVLPQKVGFTLKTRLNTREKLREVRIIPRGVGYTVEIVYHKQIPKPSLKNPKRKGG